MTMREITRPEMEKIGSIMRKAAGIDVHSYRKDFFGRCVFNRILWLKLSSLEDYLPYLESSGEEADKLRKALSVYHSQFNRDPMKYTAVRDVLLRETLARNRQRRKVSGLGAGERYALRIWSAGCAGGEEPYTIAMMVSEMLGAEKALWDVCIYATDINPDLIAKGRQGIYDAAEISKGGLPARYLETYFNELDEHTLSVSDSLRSMVMFSLSDLSRDRMPQGVDIIFCRNVLIYFDHAAARRIITDFHRSMNAGGFLVLGNSEVLEDSFLTVYTKMKSNGEYFYRKIQEGSAEHAEALKRWKDVQAGLGVQP